MEQQEEPMNLTSYVNVAPYEALVEADVQEQLRQERYQHHIQQLQNAQEEKIIIENFIKKRIANRNNFNIGRGWRRPRPINVVNAVPMDSIAGGIVYAFFGNVRQATIGPSAILTLLSYQFAREGNPELIALISFLTGLSVLMFGFLNLALGSLNILKKSRHRSIFCAQGNLKTSQSGETPCPKFWPITILPSGFIIDFVSIPVISGYTSAVTLVIFFSQIKGLLGIKFQAENFLTTLCKLASNAESARLPDAALGIFCFLFLIFFKQVKNLKYAKESRAFFYVSTSKNALVVFISTILAICLEKNGQNPFLLTGSITGGLPPFGLPNFNPYFEGEKHTFFEILKKLSLGLPTITCISIITMVVIGKAYTKGQQLDIIHEIFALGASNLLGSFIGSMPVTGSFSRSAVNNSCNVKTPISGIYSALLVILACAVLTPYFYFIPRATLAAVIMAAVLPMFEYEIILPMWKTSRKDLIPLCGTFFSSLLLGVEKGLICGLIFDLVFLIYYNARPSIHINTVQQNNDNYVMITPRNGFLYPAANYVHEKIVTKSNIYEKEKISGYVLNLVHVTNIDYTTIQTIKSIMNDLLINGKELMLTNPREKFKPIIQDVLPKIRIMENLSPQNMV